MTRHQYGGVWTQEKLKILDEYAKVYSRALEKIFTLHYADVFAGTGKQDLKQDERQASVLEIEALDGSVAKMVNQGTFHRFHFNDNNPLHCKALKDLAVSKGIEDQSSVSCMDASEFVSEFTASLGRRDRVLMFIDPYSTQLEWNALEKIANSRKIDAWLLFPIGPVSRLLPKDKEKLIDAYRRPLNRLWGTSDWEDELYRDKDEPLIEDMFAFETGGTKERVDQSDIEGYCLKRLRSIFPLVEGPHSLYSSRSKLFNLYFCCANPDPKAMGLAKRLASNVFKRAKLKEF